MQAGCALMGGETAEMPGFYPGGRVRSGRLHRGRGGQGKDPRQRHHEARRRHSWRCPPRGVHSNGFSLVRKVFDVEQRRTLKTAPDGAGRQTLGEALLTPTRIYVKPVLALLEAGACQGASPTSPAAASMKTSPAACQTGCCARIEKEDVRTPPIFHLMQKEGGIPERDMFNTFNMGVGMVRHSSRPSRPTRHWTSSTRTASLRLTAWASLQKARVWSCAEHCSARLRRRHQPAGPAGQRSPRARTPAARSNWWWPPTPGVYALERAAKAGVRAALLSAGKDYAASEDFDAALLAVLQGARHRPGGAGGLSVHAGPQCHRGLSAPHPQRPPRPHPIVLRARACTACASTRPRWPGACKVTGATVHFVNEECRRRAHPAAKGRGHPARRYPRGAAEAGDGAGRVEAAAQGSGHDL